MLAPLPDHPFGFPGGMPMHEARWIVTHAIESVEMAPAREDGHDRLRLKAGDEHLDTMHGHVLVLSPWTIPDGHRSMVGIDSWIRNPMVAIVEWEMANPGEKKLGFAGRPLAHVAENVADLILMGPEGEPLIDALDAELAKADQTNEVVALRRAARKDPTDAAGTSMTILRALPLAA